jgi:cell division protein FtsI (penicillin-binding protein 3)
MRGESWRIWSPIAILIVLALSSSQKLVRPHVDPEVSAPKYEFSRPLSARRGSIYSANGKNYPFVRSVPFWEYHLDPVNLTNAVVRRRGEPRRPKAAIVKTISDALGLDYRRLMRMADDSSKRYQFLALSSDPDAHRMLADSKLVSGVSIEDRQVRQYIHGRRLCHVLGSVNAEHVGSAGIEQRYERDLAGTPGTIRGMRDARRRELYDKRIVSIDPIPGADIYLTIDHNIQFEVEDALKWGVGEYGAGSGWCIVMDPATGAILAMASLPDFDPVSYGRTGDSEKVNRAIAFNFEPGSVMKVITAAAAIDLGVVTPQTMYSTNRNDDRYYRLPNDSHAMDPRISVKDAIVHSSNIVIGKLGYDLGPERLWNYMRRFGFGAKTGIELPGEQYGILHNWRKWDKATWSRAPIGQGISVTAIQMASAYQAIANDGVRMKPYIVQRVIDADGDELYRHEPRSLGACVSAATAQTMRKMMIDVATPGGTARRAAIRGYTVAGKTGTAQKAIGGKYAPGLYRATFCGMIPAMDPQLLVLVTLDFDKCTRYHQGGNSAGPVFRRIATAALRYLMVPPDKPDELAEFDDDDEYDRVMDERAAKYQNN